MSWAAYITNLEQGKGKCKFAGIYGKSPFSVWAESASKADFPLGQEDITNILRAITNQDMNIMSTGLKIGGKLSFTCLRLEQDLLLCQGKGDCKDHSLVVATSTQAIIVGFNPDPDVKTASLREGVEGIRDYLRNAGY